MANIQSKKKHLVVELYLTTKVQYLFLWEKNFYKIIAARSLKRHWGRGKRKNGSIISCAEKFYPFYFFDPPSDPPNCSKAIKNSLFYPQNIFKNTNKKSLETLINTGFSRLFALVAEEGFEPTAFGL
jgi:hypothetical protein